MSRREFHFVSGASSKFWAIDLKGAAFDVTFGKIGTAGTTQTKSFADAATAKKAYDKLVEEKTSKGYVEIAATGAASSSNSGSGKKSAKASTANGAGPLDEIYFSTTKNRDDIGRLTTFIGKKVVQFKSLKSIKPKDDCVYRIHSSYEDEDGEGEVASFGERLTSFLQSDAAPRSQGFIVGNWSAEDSGTSSDGVRDALIKNKDNLAALKALFIGDMSSEDCEISWITQCDLAPLLKAFPQLEMLRIRGGTELAFKNAKSGSLRALGMETGGLSKEVVGQICKADLPELEYLELWLGDENYGGTTQVNDLQPILKGKAFPKLKYLGLRNSEIADDIAGVVINSPIVKQIETLDLSLGTLSDEGGKALMKLPTDGKLKRLDLHRHFLSTAMMKQLKSLPFTLNVADQEKPDDWGDGERRFVAIGE